MQPHVLELSLVEALQAVAALRILFLTHPVPPEFVLGSALCEGELPPVAGTPVTVAVL